MRFPEFSGEWDLHIVGDYLSESKIIGSNGKDAKKLSVKLWSKGIVEKHTVFEGSEQTQYYIRKAGQLMYGKLDFLNCAFGIVPPELDGYESTLDSPAFDVKEIDITFLLNRIIQKSFYKKNGDIANGSRKAKRIHPEVFLNMELNVPCLDEQVKIAKFLTLIDKRIARQRELVESLKSYKRGVLSAIFSMKIRFRKQKVEAYPEWQIVKLSDLFSKISTRNSNNIISNVITNSAEFGLLPQVDFFDKEIANSENTSGYYIIEKNDFVYNPRKSNSAPYGPFNRYPYDEKGIISPLYTALKLKKQCNVEYLSWYFKSSSWYRYIYDNGSQGVRHDRVSMTDELLLGIPILIPCDKEQARIANFLSSLNSLFDTAEKLLDAMIQIKDRLLNEMFI